MSRYAELVAVSNTSPTRMGVYKPLQRDSADGSDFFVSYGHSQADLTGHTRTADDRSPQAQRLDKCRDDAHVAILSVCVRAGRAILGREAPAMARKIKRIHGTPRAHPGIVHDTVILSAVAPRCVQEHNRLLTLSGVFVEHLASAPDRSIQKDIFAGQMVLFGLGLCVLFHGSALSVMCKLEDTAPDVGPLRKGLLVALDFDAFLLYVHAVHAPVALIRRDWHFLEKLLPLLWERGERKQGVFRGAGLGFCEAIGYFDEQRIVRAAGFDAESSWTIDCVRGCKGFELRIRLEKLGELVEASLQRCRKIRPIGHGFSLVYVDLEEHDILVRIV